jgi:hypothetical protein
LPNVARCWPSMPHTLARLQLRYRPYESPFIDQCRATARGQPRRASTARPRGRTPFPTPPLDTAPSKDKISFDARTRCELSVFSRDELGAARTRTGDTTVADQQRAEEP